MTDTTLVQRLRANAERLSKTGILGQRPAMLEAADEIDRLTAELAEARKVIQKSDEDLRSIFLHIEEHSFSRANGIICQALSRIQSFLASKGE